MQAINRLGSGPFNEVDEEVLSILSTQAGIALNNANIHVLALKSKEKVKSLLDIIQAMHGDLGMNSLMFTITHRACGLVESDRCTLFMVDKAKNELWALQGEVNIRIPVTQGIAGFVASSGETVNIKEAYEDPRFSQAVDKKSGYVTRTILAMALRSKGGDVIGVLQLINKSNGTFDEEDEQILATFLSIAGPILENSQLFHRAVAVDDGSTEFSGKTTQHRHLDAVEMNKIEEDENEEEEA